MTANDKRKQSLYFPEEMLKEIQAEASRQDRSLSWIVQKAWRASRKELARYPGANGPSVEEPSAAPPKPASSSRAASKASVDLCLAASSPQKNPASSSVSSAYSRNSPASSDPSCGWHSRSSPDSRGGAFSQ